VSAKRTSKKLILFVKSKDIFVRTVVTLKEKNMHKAISLRMLTRKLLVVVSSKVNFVDNPKK
jgi:hypothetical protein